MQGAFLFVRRCLAYAARLISILKGMCSRSALLLSVHSNKTTWPWYSNVAPISWLIYHDVQEGRQKVNFTEWDNSHGRADRAVEQVSSGSMPRWYYVLIHPTANLTAGEKDQLIKGLNTTLGAR